MKIVFYHFFVYLMISSIPLVLGQGLEGSLTVFFGCLLGWLLSELVIKPRILGD